MSDYQGSLIKTVNIVFMFIVLENILASDEKHLEKTQPTVRERAPTFCSTQSYCSIRRVY